MDLIGQTLKHYQIRQEIASGGYGAVYEALDTSVNRSVAIKTILPTFANQAEFKQRFQTEAELVASLEHPHIIPIYHFWQDEQGAFLVMRYIRNGNLREVMKIQGAMALLQVQRIMRQICSALDISHRQGVIHRDIKPENILLDAQGNAYLSDFGIAKNLHTDDDITATGSIVGTWKYLSPEQIQNETLSPQTDMYAIGIMLYELLAGKHPYGDTPVTLMLLKHMSEDLPDIAEERPDLPRELNVVIQRATAKTASERYPNISAFINEFNNVVEGIPVSLTVADTKPNITEPVYIAPRPKTSQDRTRYAMIQNVRTFWIEGVLYTSLNNVEQLDLNISPDYESVQHPWQKLLNIKLNNDETDLTSKYIMQYFESLNGKLLIMGNPGAGKTTMLLALTEQLLRRAELDPAYPIPIVLNLSTWAQNRATIEQWIEDELHTKYQTPRQIANTWIESDNLTLMLDGLDEVDSQYRSDCVEAINTYREKHGFVDIVMCCRTEEYQQLITQVMLNGAIRIDPLTDTQIRDYLNTLGDIGQRTQRLIDTDPTFQELSRAPLTLRILVQTYQNVPSGDVTIMTNPIEQRRQLFDLYSREMLNRRVNETGYSAQTIRRNLTWLAQQMQSHNLSIFQLENLQPNWLNAESQKSYNRIFITANIVSQATVWGLPRLLQADEIAGMSNIAKALIWSASGGTWGLAIGTGAWIWRFIPWIVGIVFALGIAVDSSAERGIMALVNLPVGIMIYGGLLYVAHIIMKSNNFQHDHIHTVELLQFSRHHIRPTSSIIGVLAGIATTFVNSSVYNGDPATTIELITGIALGGSFAGLSALFVSGLRASPITTAVRPNQGIRQSLRNGLQMGMFIGGIFFLSIFLATAPVSTVSFGITQGIISAISFGFNGFLVFGGYSVIQHMLVRVLLARQGQVEINMADFLDTASSLLLMRKVGSGYIFIHRYLLEYFAESEDN